MTVQGKPQHFQHPVRATLLAFALLSVFVGIFMPFEPRVREAWPFALGFCAVLAVASVGLARVGSRSLSLFLASCALAICPFMVGLVLLRTGSPLETFWMWLHVSWYLFHALGVLMLCLAARGWYLYFSVDEQTTAERDAYSRS